MAPPTPLSIATSSLQRLVKEEASYHRELLQQEQSIRRLELDQSEEAEEEQGNRDFQLRQERKALEETNAVFPSLRERISNAVSKLESLLDTEGDKESESNVQEITNAKEAIAKAKTAQREIA